MGIIEVAFFGLAVAGLMKAFYRLIAKWRGPECAKTIQAFHLSLALTACLLLICWLFASWGVSIVWKLDTLGRGFYVMPVYALAIMQAAQMVYVLFLE